MFNQRNTPGGRRPSASRSPDLSLAELLEVLGLTCPVCGTGALTVRRPAGTRWRCPSCKVRGDSLDLIAWHLTGEPFDPDASDAVHAWLQGRRGVPDV